MCHFPLKNTLETFAFPPSIFFNKLNRILDNHIKVSHFDQSNSVPKLCFLSVRRLSLSLIA